MLKIIPILLCLVENYHYLCTVFTTETAAKIQKKAENEDARNEIL